MLLAGSLAGCFYFHTAQGKTITAVETIIVFSTKLLFRKDGIGRGISFFLAAA
jgi:hypothetical protein